MGVGAEQLLVADGGCAMALQRDFGDMLPKADEGQSIGQHADFGDT